VKPAATAERPAATLRVDKWLWHARLCKTRSLAGRLCAAGAVRLADARPLKAHHPVRIGDRLTVEHGGWRRSLEVCALGERRGPAVEARTLYRHTAEPEALGRAEMAMAWQPLLADDDDPADIEA
jgi:ribosome-associated heat shock protein Hsp15